MPEHRLRGHDRRHGRALRAAVKVEEGNTESEREADRLIADPRLAYEAQADMLEKRLARLREMEQIRTDRFEARTDVPPILEVKDLCIKFPRHGDVNVVDHLSFVVRPRQTMGLVGESGCGKSITSLTIMGLLDPKAQISGEILYDGKNLLDMTDRERNAAARPRDRHGLPGRPVLAEPLDAHQRPDEAADQARRHPQRRGAA